MKEYGSLPSLTDELPTRKPAEHTRTLGLVCAVFTVTLCLISQSWEAPSTLLSGHGISGTVSSAELKKFNSLGLGDARTHQQLVKQAAPPALADKSSEAEKPVENQEKPALKVDKEDKKPEEESTEYQYTSFPGFGRKGISPGMRAGDPVLNKYNKFVYYQPCEENDNCWSEKTEDIYNKWKDLKQGSMDTDEQMENQLKHVLKVANRNMEACKEAYAHDEGAAVDCQQKEGRKVCYSFANLDHTCEWSKRSRIDAATGTVYWDKEHELKACESDSKKAMDKICKKSQKLPGVSVSHWPWQDWKMNLGKDSFSGDNILGPESWSGRFNSN